MTNQKAAEIIAKYDINGFPEAFAMAVEALERQEPVKPVIRTSGCTTVRYVCGSCGSFIWSGENAKYCEQCGRPVKWE